MCLETSNKADAQPCADCFFDHADIPRRQRHHFGADIVLDPTADRQAVVWKLGQNKNMAFKTVRHFGCPTPHQIAVVSIEVKADIPEMGHHIIGMIGFGSGAQGDMSLAKLPGVEMMVGTFDAIGVGQWFRYVTGAI